jgi:hypothetical protein
MARAIFVGTMACAALAGAEERTATSELWGSADRLSVRSGRLVAKVVETDDRTEVLSIAGIRGPLDLDRLLGYACSPLGVRRAEDSLGEGRLSSPPTVSDFAGLRLDERDLESLSRCRVGDCRVRLTADAISTLRRRGLGSAPDRTRDLEEAYRAILADEAAAYLAGGHSSLVPYGDGPNSVHRAEGLDKLVLRPLYLLQGAADLAGYLRSFPASRPRLRDEFLSWRQERFWRKPVIGLYHTMIWETSNAGQRRILVASKQFYASHFYESAVELLEIRKNAFDPEADLAFVSRVRADIRPSGFTWLERALLRRLVGGRLEDQFERLRARLWAALETRKRADEDSPEGTLAHP